MAQNNQGLLAAGYRIAQYGVLDATGVLLGGSATAPSAGATGSGLIRLLGATGAPLAVPEAETVPIPGDDGVLAQFDFEAANLPNGVITMSVRDMVFESIVQRTKIATLGSSSMVLGAATPNYNPESIFFMFSRRAQRNDSVKQGTAGWEHVLALVTTVTPLQSEFAIKAPAVYSYKISLSKTNTLTWWATFTEAEHGRTVDSMLPMFSDYPVHLIRYTGNNVLVTFNLEFSPISVSEIRVYVNGNPVTVSSVSVANKTFTLASAPALDAKIVVIYGYDANEVV